MIQIRNLADLGDYDALSSPDPGRAYNAISSDDRKRIGELRAFVGFADVSGMAIERASVVCLDPPHPDICCTLDSSRYLFELGEVVDKDLARRYAESLKTRRITGGCFSQDEPLNSMIALKARKRDQTGGGPVDLLLYYWKQPPDYPVLGKALTELSPILSAGPFSRIWFYEYPGKLLGMVSPSALRGLISSRDLGQYSKEG